MAMASLAPELLQRAAFAALQPLCIGLVQSGQDTLSTVQRLGALQAVMEGLPAAGLQACMDYILFPLFHHLRPGSKLPVTEAATTALRVLLAKCPVGPPQFVPVLQTLIQLLGLPSGESSEELRRSVLETFGAFLSGLGKEELRKMRGAETLAARGHLLSLFLKVADEEVAAGARGSKRVHALALSTLDTFLQKIDDPDALAFFLPGVASGLSRALLAPKAGTVGISAAARALSTLLTTVIGDKANPGLSSETPSLGDQASGLRGPGNSITAADALQVLRDLSLKTKVPPSNSRKDGEPASSGSRLSENGSSGAVFPKSGRGSPDSMRVARDATWIRTTVPRLQTMLQAVLPKLCASSSAKVRGAAGHLAARLLDTCQRTLFAATPLLLECLLALSFDDYASVAAPARAFLSRTVISAGTDPPASDGQFGVSEATLGTILERQLVELPRSLNRADEAAALLQARRAAAVLTLQVRSGNTDSFSQTAFLSTLAGALLQCLEFESSPGHVAEYQPPAQYLTLSGHEAAVASVDAPDKSLPAPLLPRPPDGLAHVRSRPMYEALARICRLIGRGGMQGGFASLAAVTSPFLGVIQQTAASLEGPTSRQDSDVAPPQRAAATAVLILNEIVFGASPAWNEEGAFTVNTEESVRASSEPRVAEPDTVSKAVPQESASRGTIQLLPGETSLGFAAEERTARVLAAGNWLVKPDHVLAGLVNRVVREFLALELWDCPVGTSRADGRVGVPLSTAGDNSKLQQMMIEGVGAFARALGRSFVADGALVLAVLFPLLSKLGSPNPQVSSSADLALQSICAHGGYPSLRAMVAANSDYVVDALCRQLRHVHLHPTAPLLFVSVLRKTRATADLIPLLAEPLRSVLQGLGVRARAQHPQHALAFLMALREVAQAAADEADEILREVSEVSEAGGALKEDSADVSAEPLDESPSTDVSVSEQDPGNAFLEGGLGTGDGKGNGGREEVTRGVRRGQPRGMDDGELDEWWAIRTRRREAAAELACSVVDACAPLMGAKSVQSRVVAMNIAEVGMHALAAAVRAERIPRPATEEAATEATEQQDVEISNRVLPRVHSLWPHVVLGLAHPSAAVPERTLRLITSLAVSCGGSFMARRIETDAWPLMIRLLRNGVPSTGARMSPRSSLMIVDRGKGDEGLSSSPAADLRVQEGVLTCLRDLGGNESSSGAIGRLAGNVADEVSSFLRDVHPQRLRDLASEAMLALANVDPDAVWVILVDLANAGRSIEIGGPPPVGLPAIATILPASTTVPLDAREGAQKTLRTLAARENQSTESPW